jgi:hypothetical protein
VKFVRIDLFVASTRNLASHPHHTPPPPLLPHLAEGRGDVVPKGKKTPSRKRTAATLVCSSRSSTDHAYNSSPCPVRQRPHRNDFGGGIIFSLSQHERSRKERKRKKADAKCTQPSQVRVQASEKRRGERPLTAPPTRLPCRLRPTKDPSLPQWHYE